MEQGGAQFFSCIAASRKLEPPGEGVLLTFDNPVYHFISMFTDLMVAETTFISGLGLLAGCF